jgi:predicted metal-dependent peptidase
MSLDTDLAAPRLWAVTKYPYLARALFACTAREAVGSDTIAVDESWQLQIDPAVLAELDTNQTGRLLVHLVSHLVRQHAARAEHVEDRARWNRCGDAEINDDLLADDCVPAVAGTLPADLGCTEGGLAEAYYASETEVLPGWDCGSGADGVGRPWDQPGGLRPGQAELLRLGVAADIQRDPGSVAAGWLRWAQSVSPSRTDWRRVLAAELRSAVAAVSGSVDYSYRRPSRRAHTNTRIVLPSMVRPVPDIAIVCDTSGSMDSQLLARALAEIEALLARAGLRGRQVRVLSVDAQVHAVDRVNRASQVQLAGGGGTDMGAGIEAAVALRPRPSIIVVLTDGFTPWPVKPPRGSRVVVGILGSRVPGPDWARTVHIDL